MNAFGLAVFAGAALLFTAELMLGKAVLPWFGGGASVWTACMLFFQAALLAGYAYALGITRLSRKGQALVHLLALIACGLQLFWQLRFWGGPLVPPASLKFLTSFGIAGVFGVLLLCVGLPFVALAASAPLLQHWFGLACASRASFRLYALSNLGSVVGLLAYPFVFEPNLTLRVQGFVWSVAFFVYMGLVLVAARRVRATALAEAPEDARAVADGAGEVPASALPPATHSPTTHSENLRAEAASGGRDSRPGDGPVAPRGSSARTSGAGEAQETPEPEREPRPRAGPWLSLQWMALSACGCIALIATTNQLCQDIAPMPLLWVLPLATYLASFVIAFDSDRWYRRDVYFPLFGVGLLLVSWLLVRLPAPSRGIQVASLTFVLFVACMIVHGELHRLRPPPAEGARYYLFISIGGAAGAAVANLVAPFVFSGFDEYWLSLVAVAFGVALVLARRAPDELFGWRPAVRLLGALALAVLGAATAVAARHESSPLVLRERNFFGVQRVVESTESSQRLTALKNGSILHGWQYHGADRRTPTAYYGRSSGVGLAIDALRSRGEGPLSIAALGLGVGTIAAYGMPGDEMTFYEIDPKVITLAQGSGGYFTFLSDSAAALSVRPGDARILLEEELPERAARRDLLVVDTFSGDAIPAHLLTVQALETYLAHLRPRGLLAIHISNKHLRLSGVVLAAARSAGLASLGVLHEPPAGQGAQVRSTWTLLARDQDILDEVAARRVPGTEFFRPRSEVQARAWRDDFSTILDVL